MKPMYHATYSFMSIPMTVEILVRKGYDPISGATYLKFVKLHPLSELEGWKVDDIESERGRRVGFYLKLKRDKTTYYIKEDFPYSNAILKGEWIETD